jgi:hypothetical protein
MALARWQRTIVDQAGNILPGAQITVRREEAGAPLAVLYSDRDGATPLGNPFTADGTTAFAAFHALGGAHRIDVVSGAFSQTLRYVAVGTAAEYDSIINAENEVNLGDAASLEIPNGPAPTLDDDGEIAVDTTISDFAAGVLQYFAGEAMGVVAMPVAQFASPNDGEVPTYNAATNQFEMAAAVSAGINLQVFTASATYTPTSGMKNCLVFSTGGGGGGGGADSDGSSAQGGGGGGAGATCIERFDAATIGASQTVTIGAGGTAGANTGGNGGNGGDTTFGALHTAGGGSGGTGVAGTVHHLAAGGAGGIATGGAINIGGGGGFFGLGFVTDVAALVPCLGGNGGASFWGGGATGPITTAVGATAGNNGAAYGSGASGAVNRDTAAGAAGGVGAGGIVVVIEFI